jgi:pimeloyl-ACP methyl ester carboxylesterase
MRPGSFVLAHGAGSAPWIFDGWDKTFAEWSVVAVDLQRGSTPEHASMADYAAAIRSQAEGRRRPLVLCGWSMGGLVVLMATPPLRPDAVVLLEPSPPGETQGFDETVVLTNGVFDPEAIYGRFPPGIPARPESQQARAERRRGISVPAVPCRCLVVFGDEFTHDRGHVIADHYGGDRQHFAGLDHWGLVTDTAVRAFVARWLSAL